MKPHPAIRSVRGSVLAPIKLFRMSLRTFRPDSSSPNDCGAIDRRIFITMPRIDALSARSTEERK